jgi:maltose alpha-D-glucosyltransferase/alpha-amylase
MRFWLDRGLDGFRCDAVPYLVEREGTSCENLPETHAILKEFRAVIDQEYGGDRILLAEANQWPEDVRPYFGNGDEFHMSFHFPLMPRMYMAIAQEDRFPISDIIRQTPVIPENCQWAIFLRNHDELTLEMVTDKERDLLWSTYAADRRARLNLGIRRRLAPLLEHDRNRIELMNMLLLSMPGTPVIYYGDEIGMRYVEGLAHVTKPGGRLFLACFSDEEPGTEGPRRVSRQAICQVQRDRHWRRKIRRLRAGISGEDIRQ